MKTTVSIKIRRAAVTLFFALLIFASSFFQKTRLQGASSILSGCVLGGFQGAGATGLFIIIDFIKDISSFSEKSGRYTALFFSALITGLVSGFPSPTLKKIKFPSQKKTSDNRFRDFFPIRIILGCISGYFIFYLFDFFLSGNKIDSNLILGDLLKGVAIVIASSALRPLIAKNLYPKSETEKEIEEIMNKLKKTGHDIRRGL